MLYCLIAFILGYLFNRMNRGDGFIRNPCDPNQKSAFPKHPDGVAPECSNNSNCQTEWIAGKPWNGGKWDDVKFNKYSW